MRHEILDLGLGTTTTTGKLMLDVPGGVAEFERAMMLERRREGIAEAKAEGKYPGRAPKARRQAEAMQEMAEQGMTGKAISEALGVSERSVYRGLKRGSL